MSCVDGQEVFVKESLLAFLETHIPQADLRYSENKWNIFTLLSRKFNNCYVIFSHVDEIVLSYVVSILEELGSDWEGQEDLFDVEAFSEMLTAYFPEFATISHSSICDWIFELASTLSKSKQSNNSYSIVFYKYFYCII